MPRSLALLLLLSTALPALAADRPILRAEATVSSDLVRLGDLIDGAGDAATVPVFRAPDLGATGTVQAARILAAAQQNGIAAVDTQGLAEVAVTRASRTVSLDEMRDALTLTLARRYGIADEASLTLSFDAGVRAAYIEPTAAGAVQVVQINWMPATGRFDAAIAVEGSTITARAPIRVGGTAVETVSVPVFARAMRPGELIRAADIGMTRLPRAQVGVDTLKTAGPAIGQATRRSVRAGQPVGPMDLTKPTIVGRNDSVTLTYEVPGLVLTVRAKALDSGAEGDTIAVLNAQSSRVVQATIDGPGHVSVVAPARLAFNN